MSKPTRNSHLSELLAFRSTEMTATQSRLLEQMVDRSHERKQAAKSGAKKSRNSKRSRKPVTRRVWGVPVAQSVTALRRGIAARLRGLIALG